MKDLAVRTHLHRSGRSTVTVVTYAIALLAWLALLVHDFVEELVFGHTHGPEHLISADPTAPGVWEATALADGTVGVLHYLAMWGLMMVAMMYPSTAGIFQWYANERAEPRSGDAGRNVAAFAAGYTLLWVLLGLVPLTVTAVVSLSSLAATWDLLYFGVVLLAVGAFQTSPVKRSFLGRCRSPSVELFDGDESGIVSAIRAGWNFGWVDVGSCGVLMGLMVAVGSLNLAWMLVITVVLLLERLTPRGQLWANRSGLLAATVGIGLVVVWAL